MTSTKAIEQLKHMKLFIGYDAENPMVKEMQLALDMAIKALEQQSTNAKTYLKRREENYVEYNVEWFLKNWELELEILSGGKIKPTDADCISRQAVLDVINFEDEWLFDANSHNADTKIAFSTIKSKISEMPSVTPQQRVGKWIAQDIHNCHTDFKCSECGYIHNFTHLYGEPTADYTYCPRCGAKMEVEE